MSIADLPLVNASINSAVFVLLVMGYVLIRQNKRTAHKWVMLLAVVLSALFLVSYVVYHVKHGSTKFTGHGIVRPIYFTVLLSHTILAIANLPFVVLTVYRGLKGDFARHLRIAKRTWAIWLYVAITGPIVYVMLYRMYPTSEERERLFLEARNLHHDQQDEAALALYRQAEELGSRAAGCYAAIIGDRLRETETASAALAKALAEEPENAHCLVLKARELVYADQPKEALPLLERAVARESGDAFFWASLAFARFRLWDYERAAAAFEKSIALDPSLSVNVYNAGYAYFLGGHYAKAKPLIEKALAMGLDPELAVRAKEDLEVITGAAWICPMHPEVVGKAGETCPKCGMALEVSAHGLKDE